MPSRRATSSAQNLPRGRVQVLVPLPLAGPFDYLSDLSPPLAAGDYVQVPFGKRELTGCVWRIDKPGAKTGEETETLKGRPLKKVTAVLEAPPMPDSLRRFIDWVAHYTCAPQGAVLKMAMSVPKALTSPAMEKGYVRSALEVDPSVRLTAERQKVLAALTEHEKSAGTEPSAPLSAAELARRSGVTPGVVKGLAKAGILSEVERPVAAPFDPPDLSRKGPSLSKAQKKAADDLVGKVRGAAAKKAGFSVTLLDGVTGSGKTEVYFEAIAAAVAKGRQALVLVPEIALTAQWLERFEQRFGVKPGEWHSDLTAGRRRATWRAVSRGDVSVLVGARSSLFLPFPDLGLIVVDEEHESAFKQEEGVIYHARDMAVVRAKECAIPIVLTSATPSLETVVNVEAGRYERLHLPERHGGAALPEIHAVDMRETPPERGAWLSPPLREELSRVFAAKEQAMLFLNRRGYAPLTLCRVCGHRFQCPRCTTWLVTHRGQHNGGYLACHHCGYSIPTPKNCPQCENEDSLTACGPGVERIAEEVQDLFPGIRSRVMASDTLSGPREAAEMIRAITAHEIDLVIGTQIIAKGHHFPKLTLVGVIDADLGLSGGDLRASEQTYQLLHQVAGRAGRAKHEGKVLLQTYMPEHAVIQALISGDRDAFMKAESEERKTHHMPPFTRLAAVIVSGPDEARVAATAKRLARNAPAHPRMEVLGPAPAPLSLLSGRYRWRLLVRAPRRANLSEWMKYWCDSVPCPGDTRIRIDIDPYSFL